jgi:hypothetical protein
MSRARAITFALVSIIEAAIFWHSSPLSHERSICILLASSRRAGSFIEASKALRSAASRSAGTPGVVTIARAMAVSAERKRS